MTVVVEDDASYFNFGEDQTQPFILCAVCPLQFSCLDVVNGIVYATIVKRGLLLNDAEECKSLLRDL